MQSCDHDVLHSPVCCSYKVYIGPGKYFVTSDVGSGRIQWYAFLGLPAGTKARQSNSAFLSEEFEGWSKEIHACLGRYPTVCYPTLLLSCYSDSPKVLNRLTACGDVQTTRRMRSSSSGTYTTGVPRSSRAGVRDT